MFRLTAVNKGFGDTFTLRIADLNVPAGESTVFIGPSGSGKSTVLRLLLGLVWPDTGQVHFEGRRLGPKEVDKARRKMGFVPQSGGLFPHLSAEANITLMARRSSWQRDRIASRLSDLTRLTHLHTDVLHRYPAQLSGGQRQRVSLMRALMLDPDVLLLDEPLGALDPLIRSDLQDDLKEIFTSLGKTVVVVTHDLAEAAYLGSRIVLMRDGGIVQEGTMEDLIRQPADEFVTRFVNAQRSPLSALEASAAP